MTTSFRIGCRMGVAVVATAAAALAGAPAAGAASSTGSATAGTAATRTAASTAATVERLLSSTDVVSQEASTTAAEQRRVTAYWTPARMKAAKPAETLLADRRVGTRGAVASARPGGAVRAPAAAEGAPQTVAAAAAALSTGSSWTGGGTVVRTTGKVFFSLGGSNYVCSGSAVNSQNRDLVLTAGHCVHEGPGSFATNWAFVPAYDNNSRPYGTFTARTLLTTNRWQRQGDFNVDVGFAVMNPLDGRDLVDTVGGQGIAFNQSRGALMHAFGYPAAPPYDGQRLIYCSGAVQQDTNGRTTTQGMPCTMTGGSSGGPWFLGFDESTGVGTLNSVNSFKYTNVADVMWGPYFGNTIQSLYNSAQTR
jgi:V8-like Glu-specific endopeptidase